MCHTEPEDYSLRQQANELIDNIKVGIRDTTKSWTWLDCTCAKVHLPTELCMCTSCIHGAVRMCAMSL